MSLAPTKSKKQKKSRNAAARSTFSQVAVEEAGPATRIEGFSAKAAVPQLKNQRYVESSKMAVASGNDTPHDPTIDALVDREAEGALDTELAEMSLGERLAVRNSIGIKDMGGRQRISGSESEGEKIEKPLKRKNIAAVPPPSHSLTRTLIQALHAGDTSLLETCLVHSDESLIRTTVMRLPSQLSVPLLTACVERLGRGPRGNGVKGRGGGASAQRGMALIKWIRTVLIIHGGHLMTMPDLTARLAHLHSTLTARLTLQERLLTLNGRLDLILSQIELRSSNAPVPLPLRKNTKKRGKSRTEPTKYVEGDSSTDDDEKDSDTASGETNSIEMDEEEDSIEDIELGDSGSDEGSEDEEEEEDGSDDENNIVNGFIDDEASEDYEEDESENDSD